MVHWIKHVFYKLKDWSSKPQNPLTSQIFMTVLCTPSGPKMQDMGERNEIKAPRSAPLPFSNISRRICAVFIVCIQTFRHQPIRVSLSSVPPIYGLLLSTFLFCFLSFALHLWVLFLCAPRHSQDFTLLIVSLLLLKQLFRPRLHFNSSENFLISLNPPLFKPDSQALTEKEDRGAKGVPSVASSPSC